MATAIPMTLENAKMIFEKAGTEFYDKASYTSFATSARKWYAVFEPNSNTRIPMIVNRKTLQSYWKLGTPGQKGIMTAIRK